MSEMMKKTDLAATERMTGQAQEASKPRAWTGHPKAAGSATGASTSKRSLPPGALRSDHVDVSGAPRRRLRPLLPALAVILGVVAFGLALRLLVAPAPSTQEAVAVLEVVHGAIEMFPADGGQFQTRLLPLAGAAIPAGTVIETGSGVSKRASGGVPVTGTVLAAGIASDSASGSHSGRAALRLSSGASLRLDVDTRVRMASVSALVLERGAVYVDTEGVFDDAGVEVRTTLGVVRDVGTQFEVRLTPGEGEPLRIRVREGKVEWSHDGETHDAGAGEELAVRVDGTVERGAVAVHGPHWDWVLETAPLPDLDGRPLRAFLDWYVREGGWTLRFADETVAELTSSTVLHGEAEGLTPDQAAAMVLRGSGLEWRLEEGVLWVEPVGP